MPEAHPPPRVVLAPVIHPSSEKKKGSMTRHSSFFLYPSSTQRLNCRTFIFLTLTIIACTSR